jgi:cobalt-zinc-cadmium efflux system membrane fusion protein
MMQDDNGPVVGPPAAPVRSGKGLLLLAVLVVGIGAGVAGGRMIGASRGSPNEPSPGAGQRVLTRIADRIVVPPNSPLRSILVVAPAESKQASRTLVLPAFVEVDPARTVKVLPPVSGLVVGLKVQLGERVKEGQELAVIDSGDLAQALSDDEKARSMLTLTKRVLDRQAGLEKGGGGAIKDREQAESDYAQAKSEFDRAEARLRSIGMATSQKEGTRLLSMTAPVAGSVTDLEIAPGDYINDTTATIMTISNLDSIWVTANVPEKDTAFVSNGQAVKVTFAAYPSETFDGKVLFVSDVLEPDTRRTKVRIAFDNPDKAFKPNMFADAAFAAAPVSRLSVPTSALLMNNESTTVFVEVYPWAFERRSVEIDYQDGDNAVIKHGLKPGDRVVTKGAVRLND